MGSGPSLRFLSASIALAATCAACTLVTAAPPPGSHGAGSTTGDGSSSGGDGSSGSGSSSGSSGSGSSGGSGADAGTTSGGGGGGGGSTNGVPTSIKVTGQVSATCGKDPLFSHPTCTLTIHNIATSLSLPAGTKLRTVFELAGENKSPPDSDWLSGFTMSKPDYPSACVMTMQWADNDGTSLSLLVYDQDAQGNDCNFTATRPEVSPADFANGFAAVVPATWVATGDEVPVTFDLTP